MNKRIQGVLIAAVLLISVGVGASLAAPNLGKSLEHRQEGTVPAMAESPGNSGDHRQNLNAPVMKGNPHQFKQLTLMYSAVDPDEDSATWTHVAGNEVSGFKLCLDPAFEYYYLDIMKLRPYEELEPGMYPFFVSDHPDTSTATSGEELSYDQYWIDRGADEGASEGTLEWLLYHIFLDDDQETRLPVFFLEVTEDGGYNLIDGFQYLASEGTEMQALRVDAMPTLYNAQHGYLLGTYKYLSADWSDGESTFNGLGVELTMTFKTCECCVCEED